jgi:pSer/pThr/pTyr-binding forkhead associated (FHA) protein
VLERLGPWALGVLVLLLTGFGLHRSRSRSSTMQRVACLLEGEAGRLEVLARDGEVDAVIGRFDVDLVIEAVTVSRRHARLFGTLGRLQLMDLGSTNGTRVNGQPCAARVAVTVSPGDRLRFGDQEFVLQSVSGSRA